MAITGRTKLYPSKQTARESSQLAPPLTFAFSRSCISRWLECMDLFVQQVVVNYQSSRVERGKGRGEEVRVALIDDGIDGADQILHKNIDCGVSFCGRRGDLSNTFYVASGGHGTLMATLIRRICPEVKLYVAKLDEYAGPSGGKQITADSAANVIDLSPLR